MRYQLITTSILLLLLLGACTQSGNTSTDWKNSGGSSDGELQKFSSVAELQSYLQRAQNNQHKYYDSGFMRGDVMMDAVMTESGAAPMAVKAGGSASESGGASENGRASDYSTTNVQVEGVDEADFVKNDDKYLYMIVGDKLVIIDAYPAAEAAIVSKTDIEGEPRDLFVNDDTIVLFAEQSGQVPVMAAYDYMPRERWTTTTHAFVYDVSDRKNPKLVHEYTLNGKYQQSRMIGENVYYIIRDNVYQYGGYPNVPVLREENTTVVKPDIYYFDNPEDSYVFTTIVSLNVNDDDVKAKSYLMGYANTIYASTKHLYIAYQERTRWDNEDEQMERFYKVVVPLLPSDARNEIERVKRTTSNEYAAWDEISAILEETYKSMDEKAKDSLLEEINDAVATYEYEKEVERDKTVIHKFTLDDGDVSYHSRGVVHGQLLNQFSMDEYNGDLRVATTTYVYNRQTGSRTHNNVYVLDEELKQVGKLEELAEDERIYSTRFIGDRLYMVTFQRIDPFFVIDLSNPAKPKVLGELKLPGYSDYLHPYDEDHIIGIGKETKENEWGGISVQGVKLALFDVSDVANPVLVDKVEIGDPGSDSEALRDHKAFLFDKEKELLVLPIREVKESYDYRGERCNIARCYPYRQRVWQGAYVYTITADGFEERGTVSHYEGTEENRYYWSSPYAVRRSLFLDDVLYTVSTKKVEMHNLTDVSFIGDVDLPYNNGNTYYPKPLPLREPMVDAVEVMVDDKA